MSNDLKPCGHCGGRARISTYKKRIGTVCRHTVIRQHAVCTKCGAQTKIFKALGKATIAWNNRQPDPQATALVEALERCAQIVEQWNHRQNEKVEDVKYVARNAIKAFREKTNA